MGNADRPVPNIGDWGSYGASTVRGLIARLIDAERASLLEGQESLPLAGGGPLHGVKVELSRDANGRLYLRLEDGQP